MAAPTYRASGGGKDTSNEVWLPADRFISAFGSPTQTHLSNIHPSWLFDSSSQEVVGTSLYVPRGWTTMNVVLHWANIAGGGSGDVIWQAATNQNLDSGEDASAGTSLGSKQTATAGAANIVVETTLLSALSVTAEAPYGLRIDRHGGDAGDTLANDARMLGILLVKAS